MQQPIYFPFTYMPESVANVLAIWFDRMTLVSLSKKEPPPGNMQSLVRMGWLSYHSPVDDNDTGFDNVLTSYREWADLHGHAQLEQFMAQKLRTSIDDDESVYQLLDEINLHRRDTDVGRKESGHRDMELLKDRIFLSIAQEFDRNNWEIQKNLATVASKERDFLKHLHATDDGAKPQPVDPLLWPEGSDLSHLSLERFRAWTGFLSQKEIPFRIFVTTSQPIVDLVVPSLPTAEPLVSINRIPVRVPENRVISQWREKFSQWIDDQVASGKTGMIEPFPNPPEPESMEPTSSLTIYQATRSPLQWFQPAVGNDDRLTPEQTDRSGGQVTLLAHVIYHGRS